MGRPRTTDVQSLVEAAARVFERHGYADATLQDVAAEAGVSKPTVYQYVKSKQRLLEIIVEQVIYPLREGIEQIVEGPDDARSRIEAYVDLHVRSATRYSAYYQVLMADQHQLSPEGLRRYQDWARQVNRSLEGLLDEGVAQGVVRPDIDVKVAANLLNSMLTSIARWYRPLNRLDPGDIRAEVMKLLEGFLVSLDAGESAHPPKDRSFRPAE
ncbi:TetR/AcrR family transcriptional regulator [Pseudonocardia kujensis]|uniref:TetR/AcrR family transcriptional regulator n=1 Tax=Pseudonocardia kujensis TaxID=1128675 RepID=UPI001E65A754|nr:TetR/AcrR family transcriptional regulator [Pseudonocardia kujensis]MCE0762444.1 TetR/AcrR family transcriptional regulator [Pseudonocardia kujensis]